MFQEDGRQMDQQVAVDDDLQTGNEAPVDPEELIASLAGWRDQLTDTLEQMPGDNFQRLILRLLEKDGVSWNRYFQRQRQD